MRWSRLFVPTLSDAPTDAEAVSHELLVRGGFIRQLHAGHFSLLPLGLRVHDKVETIVRRLMGEIGAQEFLLPAMHPASIWQRPGGWDLAGAEMFRLQDRKQGDLVLGMPCEAVFAEIAREIASYRSLPQIWHQIQWKFRDEPRPKSGLLRMREFATADSCSFDLDDAGLDHSFNVHREAYARIFQRLSLDAVAVQASPGVTDGTGTVEFVVPSPAGEDTIARCGGRLDPVRCIKVGRISKLGRDHPGMAAVSVLDARGAKQRIAVGSYGLDISRTVAAIAESHHDDRGLVWPVAVAPYEAVVAAADTNHDAAVDAAERIYRQLQSAGVVTLLDDRSLSAETKAADADLVGIPWQVTVSAGVADNEADLTSRATGQTQRIQITDAAARVAAALAAARVPEPGFDSPEQRNSAGCAAE